MLKNEFFCFVFILVFGGLFRKMYDFSKKDFVVGFFFPVNSSTWENLKLLFFAQLIYFVPQYLFFGRYQENFLTEKVFSVCVAILTALTLHIIFHAIFKDKSRVFKVFEFCLSGAASFVFAFNYEMIGKEYNFFAVIIFTAILLLFFVFTYHSPKISIFFE